MITVNFDKQGSIALSQDITGKYFLRYYDSVAKRFIYSLPELISDKELESDLLLKRLTRLAFQLNQI